MSSVNLNNLVKTGHLKKEAFNSSEFKGLIHSGQKRLEDAKNVTLSADSRFDLAYNAAHSFALAALRRQGYRSNNRYLVFQVLPHTLGLSQEVWRILAKCHERRNVAEYEGYFEVDDQLLEDLLLVTQTLFDHMKLKFSNEIIEIIPPSTKGFDDLISKAKQQAKSAKLSKQKVKDAIKEARRE